MKAFLASQAFQYVLGQIGAHGLANTEQWQTWLEHAKAVVDNFV